MTRITIDRGVPTIEIVDAGGELHSYEFWPTEPLDDAWAVILRRTDGQGESPYRVSQTHQGSWRCACPDAVYRARKARRFCKHALAAADLKLLVDRLARHRPEGVAS